MKPGLSTEARELTTREIEQIRNKRADVSRSRYRACVIRPGIVLLALYYMGFRLDGLDAIAAGSILLNVIMWGCAAYTGIVFIATLPSDLQRLNRQLTSIGNALLENKATILRARQERAIEVVRTNPVWLLDCGSQTLALCGADFLPEDSRADWPTADLTITAIPDIGVLLSIDSGGAELACSEYRPKELPRELRKEVSVFEEGIDVGIKILETRIPEALWDDDRAA